MLKITREPARVSSEWSVLGTGGLTARPMASLERRRDRPAGHGDGVPDRHHATPRRMAKLRSGLSRGGAKALVIGARGVPAISRKTRKVRPATARGRASAPFRGGDGKRTRDDRAGRGVVEGGARVSSRPPWVAAPGGRGVGGPTAEGLGFLMSNAPPPTTEANQQAHTGSAITHSAGGPRRSVR